ncbi:hypothetical protein B0T24DRAFT_637938 [Lasiosphaeria ovina]|uniref:Uncharacterized protein n=1 Tax=Lasiosphaeria ovina TaxID=92902 RepID=A0AAE0JX90_9PEZI|nr:hypothetical protein B0T24DRAFT_637938 [Lasiosphaeria ovina]
MNLVLGAAYPVVCLLALSRRVNWRNAVRRLRTGLQRLAFSAHREHYYEKRYIAQTSTALPSLVAISSGADCYWQTTGVSTSIRLRKPGGRRRRGGGRSERTARHRVGRGGAEHHRVDDGLYDTSGDELFVRQSEGKRSRAWVLRRRVAARQGGSDSL